MKYIVFFCSALVAVFFSSNVCAFTVSYDQTTTGIRWGLTQETSIKIKDEKMRMEVNTPQGKVVTIIDGGVAYQYIPSENKAYKMMTRGPSNIKNLSDYKGYLQTLNAKVIGSESVGDYDCDIYEFIDPGANVKAKAWVWRVKNFPVKYETDLPSGPVMTIMKNIKINAKIDDAEFSVPAGVEVIEMQRVIGNNKNGKALKQEEAGDGGRKKQ